MDNPRAMVRWTSIVGARPQFIKLAPICRAIAAHNQAGHLPKIEHSIIHTGQHYDSAMAELFFVELGIPEPAYNLRAGSGTHAEQLARMTERLEPVLAREWIDRVIVYGDTNSTLAGALVAARLEIPAAHVEAGCRSHNWSMPEEQNRVITDHLCGVLLAPCRTAVKNLAREGIGGARDPRKRKVALVGDVMFDALLANLAVAEVCAELNMRRLGLVAGQYYLLTLHRSENTNKSERLASILSAVEDLPLPVVFPVHPRTLRIAKELNLNLDGGNIRAIAPVGYLDMLVLTKYARKILTDSGGVQKEAFYLGVPCVTLREETEWPETVEAGANRLAGIDRAAILAAVEQPAADFRRKASPFGQGKASELVVAELLRGHAEDRRHAAD
jgi:UDP-N-acetylglucosamine 2-epimerase